MTLYDRVLNTEMDISNSHATSISAFLLFYVIDYVLQSCQWSNKTMRNTYLFIRLRNYSLSIIHAFISGLSSLICLISYPDLVGNVINSENVFAYHIMGFATGYFVHDIYHNICGDVEIRSLEIILHHITVLTCFYVVSRYRILVCYVLLGLLMELNSIFLHARKLMILLNIDPESVAYRVNAIANITTFIIFRICLTLSLFGWGIINRHKLPVVVSWILLSSFTVFTTMNLVLFYRVIIAERRILQLNHYKLSTNGVME
ncbi:unnamed protein product [Schistosoma rodhaini]|uniref:TLC domain-containing protein n=1 Tax=Schistosoma mansoni TaxID=6183 RepID=G4V9U1_SCHMA|nr:hypothetical protein Smp_140560 [Schistosoma mansoni]CAH8469743.1 unnamed protein product [Schistosoma rodhaini]|eukprot:XP_018648220.1 hypothetical protein Smp_140560 [Schistosoma mansoni]